MRIENTEVFGFSAALRGLRNPADSWARSDSEFRVEEASTKFPEGILIGLEDMKLAKKLIAAGSEHRKFIRLIDIWADFTLPRFIWTEFDTYKVGTVRMSCSTMHKLGSRDLTEEDFEGEEVVPGVLDTLNRLGLRYRASKDVATLHKIKSLLPEGYCQKATCKLSYENALNIYWQRKDHRMKEWSGPGGICEWIKSLPYMAAWLAP